MIKTKIKVSRKGQIAIPKHIRDKLKTDVLEIELQEDRIVLKEAESILSIGGSLRDYVKNYKPTDSKTSEDEKAWEKHVKEKFSRS